jgi:hypothetical protein
LQRSRSNRRTRLFFVDAVGPTSPLAGVWASPSPVWFSLRSSSINRAILVFGKLYLGARPNPVAIPFSERLDLERGKRPHGRTDEILLAEVPNDAKTWFHSTVHAQISSFSGCLRIDR